MIEAGLNQGVCQWDRGGCFERSQEDQHKNPQRTKRLPQFPDAERDRFVSHRGGIDQNVQVQPATKQDQARYLDQHAGIFVLL